LATQISAQSLRTRSIGDLRIVETRYPASLEMGRHAHEHAFMSFVLQGAYRETVGSDTWLCEPATLTVHPPGESHAVHFHRGPVRIMRLDMGPEWVQRIQTGQAAASLFHKASAVKGSAPSFVGRRLYHELCASDGVAELATEGLALELIASVARTQASNTEAGTPKWMNTVLEMLHDCQEALPSLSDLAAVARVHPVHLARAFRKRHGCTVGEYARRLRIENACRRLTVPGESLAQIAAEVGFSDQAHFTRCFKEVTGVTPGRYRQSFTSH
jgi:AraC family transcriptional regulator